MASLIAWLDHSEEERRRMREVIDLFREKGTVDELGTGQIRDALSDALFPGTSTLQTRARYHLLIPWVFQQLEREKTPSEQVPRRARTLETRLIYSLLDGDDHDGIIGKEATDNLQRLPSTVYWSGLREYGIRQFSGSIADYFRSLDSFRRRLHNLTKSESEEIHDRVRPNWHLGMPEPPNDLFDSTSMKLLPPEAEYLRDRITFHHPDSLLAHVVAQPGLANTDFAWDHRGTIPDHLSELVDHARAFSEVMHGAALLYNLELARRAAVENIAGHDFDELIHDYEYRLAGWAGMLEARGGAIADWQVDRTIEMATERNRNIGLATRTFVGTWARHALEDPHAIPHNRGASRLIALREQQTKGSLARLRNRRALEMWNTEAGTARLDYRWRVAKRIAGDIQNGLARA